MNQQGRAAHISGGTSGKGKTAYITGGSSGIGLAIARALFARGFSVALCARDSKALAGAADALAASASGGAARVFALRADVSLESEVRRWIAEAREKVGPPFLLVNNAGVGRFGEITSLSEQDWDRVLAINLKGAFLCTREILPMMQQAGAGWIVNIASVAGKKGMAGSAAYSASKFGLIGLSESTLAEGKAHGIRATAICPGYVATPLAAGASVPPAEMIQPEDVAATVLYLLDLTPKVVIREIVLERIGA